MKFVTHDGTEVEVVYQDLQRNGILLSGGLDSAVLLGALIADSNLREVPFKIQPFFIPVQEQTYIYVQYVVEHFRMMTDRLGYDAEILDPIAVGDPNSHHTGWTRSGFRSILMNHKIITNVYQATNQNPPFNAIDYAKHGEGNYPNRVKASPHPMLTLPFIQYQKNHVVSVMKDLNLHKILSELTHTCTEQVRGRCGKCFQCEERAWAYKVNGLVDTGTL